MKRVDEIRGRTERLYIGFGGHVVTDMKHMLRLHDAQAKALRKAQMIAERYMHENRSNTNFTEQLVQEFYGDMITVKKINDGVE